MRYLWLDPHLSLLLNSFGLPILEKNASWELDETTEIDYKHTFYFYKQES